MQLTDMISAIQRRIDDVIPQADAIEYLNAGVHKMESAIDANFAPYLDGKTVNTFPFPEMYHIIPVLYASALYQKANLILDSSKLYMDEFQDELKYFVEKYDVPPQYWNMANTQQFTAQAGQLAFVITKNTFNPQYNNLKIYVNNRETFDWRQVTAPASNPQQVITTTTLTNDPNGFNFNPTTVLKSNDLVTAMWVEDDSMMEPPYAWHKMW